MVPLEPFQRYQRPGCVGMEQREGLVLYHCSIVPLERFRSLRTLPTIDHPGVQLKLEHNRSMRKKGYVNPTARPVPLKLLEPLRNGPRCHYRIGYLRLDEESTNVLRKESGCQSPSITTTSNSASVIKAAALEPKPSLKIEQCAVIGGRTGLTRLTSEGKPVKHVNAESGVPRVGGGQNVFARRQSWASSLLADLSRFTCMEHKPSAAADFTRGGYLSPSYRTILDLAMAIEHCAISIQDLQRLLCTPSFSIKDIESTLPRAVFNELKRNACNLLGNTGRRPFVVVELHLYHAMTNLPYESVDIDQNAKSRKITVTKSHCLLSIRVLGESSVYDTKNMIDRESEADRCDTKLTGGHRFLLVERRERLAVELLRVILEESAWEELTQTWKPPDDSWKGPLLC